MREQDVFLGLAHLDRLFLEEAEAKAVCRGSLLRRLVTMLVNCR